MKVALVHDVLFGKGGAERVFLDFCEAFPNAHIYTSIYLPNKTYPEFKNFKIRTTFLNIIIRSEKYFKLLFFPLVTFAMLKLKLRGYDLIIVSTTHCAKYPKMDSKSFKVIYCYTPFRLAWNTESYMNSNTNTIFKKIINMVLPIMRKIDYKSAQKADLFLAMTNETKLRIIKHYNHQNEIPIIRPSIDFNRFQTSELIDDYFLVVSRFEPYKKVDLAIKAFNRSGKKLMVVGDGTQKEYLKKLAKKNIFFKENISDSELFSLFSKCKALIFPQYEDYGLTPIEANASGRPVICFRAGGAIETMIDIEKYTDKGTAIFFDYQTVESLNEAVAKFKNFNFNVQELRKNALNYDRKIFIKKIKNIIHNEIKNRT